MPAGATSDFGSGARRRRPAPLSWIAAGVIAAAGLAAYLNSFSGPFLFDDIHSIPLNPTIRRLWPIWAALRPPHPNLTVSGRPILNLSLAVDYAIAGYAPWVYHATNLAIHIAAGLALFGVARRTLARLPRFDGAASAAAALGGALLWTVDPLQTESVTYVIQRAESLMGLFYLATLYGLLRAAGGGPRPRLWLGLSWLSCLLGMGTKEVMVSAPVIAFLFDRTFLAGSFRGAWRARRGYHLALAATWIPLALLVASNGNRGGTAGAGIGVSWTAYVLTQFPAVVRYLALAAWPHPLVFDYGTQWVRDPWSVAPQAAAVAALAAGGAWLLFRRGPGPPPGRVSAARALGFAAAFFFAILAPTSLVPGDRQTMADHRMYLALAPLLVAAAAGIRAALGRRSAAVFVPLAIAAVFASSRRNEVYRSNLALWGDTVGHCPGNGFAHTSYGVALLEAGRAREATAQFEQAAALNPRDADALTNLGTLYMQAGRPFEGIAQLRAAIRADPRFFGAHANLGTALAHQGLYSEAADEYRIALGLDPGNAQIHVDYGLVLRALGRPGEAQAQFAEAARLGGAGPP